MNAEQWKMHCIRKEAALQELVDHCSDDKNWPDLGELGMTARFKIDAIRLKFDFYHALHNKKPADPAYD